MPLFERDMNLSPYMWRDIETLAESLNLPLPKLEELCKLLGAKNIENNKIESDIASKIRELFIITDFENIDEKKIDEIKRETCCRIGYIEKDSRVIDRNNGYSKLDCHRRKEFEDDISYCLVYTKSFEIQIKSLTEKIIELEERNFDCTRYRNIREDLLNLLLHIERPVENLRMHHQHKKLDEIAKIIKNVKYYKSYLDTIFFPIGGGDEIGASCYFVKIGDLKILLDVGSRFSDNNDDAVPNFQKLIDQNFLKDLNELSAVFISHGHFDHIGALPHLINLTGEEFDRIYTTSETKKIIKQQLKSAVNYNRNKDYNKDYEIIYEKIPIKDVMKCIQVVKWNNPIQIDNNCKVTFYPAGHILGASMIFIETPDRKILFTGDFSGQQRTVTSYDIPPDLEVDILITESTYGFSELCSEESLTVQEFREKIQEVLNRNGIILIPAFSVGRAQELILILKEFICNGDFTTNIFIDGLAKTICEEIYVPKGIISFDQNIQAVKPHLTPSDIINSLSNCGGIIIASSGMLQKDSKSFQYAKELLDTPKHALFITGYQDEESPGRDLLKLCTYPLEDTEERQLVVEGEKLCIKTTDIYTYRLSAHADDQKILELIKNRSSTLKKVIFIHYPAHKDGGINIAENARHQFGREIEFVLGKNYEKIRF